MVPCLGKQHWQKLFLCHGTFSKYPWNLDEILLKTRSEICQASHQIATFVWNKRTNFKIIFPIRNCHSWAKFKIIKVRKPGRKFYYFICQNTIFGSSRISFHFLNKKFKVVVFPSNFWKTAIIWQFFRVILNFSQECYYLINKVGVVDFTKTRGLLKFQSLRALRALWHL